MKRLIASLILSVLLLSGALGVSAEVDFYGYKYSPYFDELLELFVQDNYYSYDEQKAVELTLRRLLENYPELYPQVANSLLKAGDRYAGYYSGDVLGAAGAYIGVGIAVSPARIDGPFGYGIKVTNVFADTPASQAGIHIGDEIISVNGSSIASLGYEAASGILSESSSIVELVLLRDGEQVNTTLIKARVLQSDVSMEIIDDSTALIALGSFADQDVLIDYYYALEELGEKGIGNLIIDLRGNGGGNDYVCAFMIDLLTSTADLPIYSEIDRTGNVILEHKTTGQGIDFSSITLLVNRNTASAAEVFALCVREMYGAVIVGELTHGKGIGQTYHQMSDGAYITLTTIEAVSGQGTKYNGIGIKPDIPSATEQKNFKFTATTALDMMNAAAVKPTIKSTGARAVQERLYAAGLLDKSGINGVFDANTQNSLRIFKKLAGLDNNIKVDIRTVSELNKYKKVEFKYILEDNSLELALEHLSKQG